MKKIASIVGSTLGLVIGLYLIVRAVVEPFTIDMSDPATYRNDWGGPSLIGVLAAHCGPGILAGAVIVAVLRRRGSSRRSTPRTKTTRSRSAAGT